MSFAGTAADLPRVAHVTDAGSRADIAETVAEVEALESCARIQRAALEQIEHGITERVQFVAKLRRALELRSLGATL